MLSSCFSECVPALALLFLILEVRSQNIRFVDGQHNRPSIPSPSLCDADSTCRQIRVCGPFRSLPNRRELGVTCGRGGGTYRRVCCPNRSRPITVSVQTITITTQEPMKPGNSSRNTTLYDFNSGGIRFVDGQRNGPSVPSPSLCDADSTCRQIRQCGALRNLPNWREVGITCGRGGGPFRRVCCPNRIRTIAGTVLTITTTTQGPLKPRDSSRNTTLYNFNQGECGQSRPENIRTEYIMGGNIAKEGAWPWMVAIRIKVSDTYVPWCTGFLIDRKHVISAAHCYHNTDPENYITSIGRVNQDEGDTYRVGRIAVHEEYTEDMFYNDIAILTLTRDVDFPGFNPICLPDEIIINQDLTGFGTAVAGWGTVSLVSFTDGEMSIMLREIRRMPVVSNKDCTNKLRKTQYSTSFRRRFPQGINKGFICAGFIEENKDVCGGDSGGPLMRQDRNTWFAVGIVSFGYSCGQPGVPGGYTRITEYMKWIWENTRD